MRNLVVSLLAFVAFAAPSFAQTLTITGTNITDVSGASFTGKLGFTPVAAPGGPAIPAQMGGGGGQILPFTRYFNVTNGTLQSGATLADTATTSPVNLCYRVTYRYAGLPTNEADNGVLNSCFQPSSAVSGSTNLSIMVNPSNALQVVQTGPRGLPGQVAVGSVTSLPTGSNPTVTNSGTADQAIFNFGIPQGIAGTAIGKMDATQFTGADIGAKVNAAFAGCGNPACHVVIPSGSYTYSTDIVMPNLPTATLEFTAGAVLHYSGSNYAIRLTAAGPGWGSGTYQGNSRIFGPGHIIGTSAAKAGIVMWGTNGAVIDGLSIDGFTQGDGILNAGLNSCTISNNKIVQNLVGLHMAAAPASATNNCLVSRNVLGANEWGIIDGDMSIFAAGWLGLRDVNNNLLAAGVSSPNYGNRYVGNDIESNTGGAVMLGLTVGDSFSGNYIENNPRGIVIGNTENPLTSAQYNTLYGRTTTNGGTSRGTSITGNYFTAGSGTHALIEMRYAGTPVVEGNGVDSSPSGPSACFVDIYFPTDQYVGPNSLSGVTNTFCQGGAPLTTLNSKLPGALILGGGLAAGGAISGTSGGFSGQVSAPSYLSAIQFFTPTAVGSLPFVPTGSAYIDYVPGGAGRGFCTPGAHFGAISVDSSTGLAYICTADSVAPSGGYAGNASDGNGTWEQLSITTPTH